jgi:hypothetical protein
MPIRTAPRWANQTAAAIITAAFLFGSGSSTAISKCSDASGNVTYTDAPCPVSTKHTQKLVESRDAEASPATADDHRQHNGTAPLRSSVRLVEANQASEAELATVVSPAVAKQIVDERNKGPFSSWPDAVRRVVSLGAARSALFASMYGLTVNGMSLQGAPPNPQKAAAISAELKANPNLKLMWGSGQ